MTRLLNLLLFFCLLAAGSATAGVVLIGNAENTQMVVDDKEIVRIYLGKRTHWNDDTPIIPAMLKNGKTHEEFLDTYLDRTIHRFVSYWRQMVFTGKGMPPKSFANEAALIDFVAATPGAVGYISEAKLVPGVQVLSVR